MLAFVVKENSFKLTVFFVPLYLSLKLNGLSPFLFCF